MRKELITGQIRMFSHASALEAAAALLEKAKKTIQMATYHRDDKWLHAMYLERAAELRLMAADMIKTAHLTFKAEVAQ